MSFGNSGGSVYPFGGSIYWLWADSCLEIYNYLRKSLVQLVLVEQVENIAFKIRKYSGSSLRWAS